MNKTEFNKVKEAVLKEIEEFECSTPYDFIKNWIYYRCRNKIWSDRQSSKAVSVTTYGLKHRVEEDYIVRKDEHGRNITGYCANNWVKCALYELGFDLKGRNGELVNADTMLNNGVNYYYRLK